MYNFNKVLLRVLSCLLAVQIVAETVVLGPLVARMSGQSATLLFLAVLMRSFLAFKLPALFPGCVPANSDLHIWAYWVPLSAFQGTIFLLAIAKVCEIGKRERRRPQVLVVLFRDTLSYFGMMFAIILVNVLIWSVARVRMAPVHSLGTLTFTVPPLCSRHYASSP